MEALKERGYQLLSLMALVAAWLLLSVVLDTSALPPPHEVAAALWDLVSDGDAFPPLASTLQSTTLGFVVGFVTGIAYGVAVYVWGRFGEVFNGLFNAVLFAPTLILIFLGLVMFGHKSRLTVVLIAGLVVFPNVAVYVRDALNDLDDDVKSMALSYKVVLPQMVRDVYVPYLIPTMLASGRVAFSLAWKVAFLTEVFGYPEGLGWRVRNAYTVYDMTTLLAWLTVFIIAILMIEQLTRVVERGLVKW